MSNNKVVLATQPGGGLHRARGLVSPSSLLCYRQLPENLWHMDRETPAPKKKNPNSPWQPEHAAVPAACLHAACTHVLRLPARCLHPHARLARSIVASTHVLRLPAPTCPGCPQRCLHPCTQAACTLPVPWDFGVIYTLFGTFTTRLPALAQGLFSTRVVSCWGPLPER